VTRNRASRPTRRAGRTGLIAAVLLGLLGSGCLIWQTSHAAYSANTQNGPDSWTTGTLTLTDDDGGTALFTASGLRPGSTGTRCIVVTSTGSLPATVKVFGKDRTTTKSLADHITITVANGSGGSAGSCTGFTAEPGTAHTSTLAAFPLTYAAGVSSWALTGTAPETRTYQITYTVDPNAPDSTQDATASMSFVWEAQTPAS
jgi:hypothetical protein